MRVSACGAEYVLMEVTDPAFGRIARVRLDHSQAAQLANAIDDRLVDSARRSSIAPE